MIVTFAWLAGFAGFLVWVIQTTRRAREHVGDTVPRALVIAAALVLTILGFSAVYVWGTSVARRGMDRIQSSDRDVEEQSPAAEPPRARLFLRHVQLSLTAVADRGDNVHRAMIGYSPDATLRLPRSYGLREAKQGWDLLHINALGPQGLRVAPIAHPEPTGTRVIIHAQRRAIGEWPSPRSIARTVTRLTGRGTSRCRTDRNASESESDVVLNGPGAVYAILCRGRTPTAALVLERDLLAVDVRPDRTPVRITPLVWRGGRWRTHHVQIASGSLIQIGTMADALPGVTLWEVPAPSGRAELFFPPDDLLASCPEWLSGRQRQGFFSYPGHVPGGLSLRDGLLETPVESRAGDSICVLPFTPPFGLEVRRLLPDIPGIGARSLWAAGLMITPALLLLLLLCARPRGELTAVRFQRLVSLGWLASLLSAIGVWRLLWAHRIDMLRDYESVGMRVLQNQVVLVLGGAAFAASCALAWAEAKERRQWRVRVLAVLAWLTWLFVGGYALRGDIAEIAINARLMGQVAISLILGTALAWLPSVQTRLSRIAARVVADDSTRAWLIPIVGLVGICIAAFVAKTWAPRVVMLKLSLAWMFVLIVYSATRASFSPSGMATVRALSAIVMGGIGAMLLARFDPGVAVAVAGPGFLAALLFASHDARFADSSLRMMDSYKRHHAPLVLAHAGLIWALGGFIALWAVLDLLEKGGREPDAMLSSVLTSGAIHVLLFLALLFLAAASVAYLRRGSRAAIPWLVIALLMSGLWAGRNALIDRVLSSSTQAANRIAIVLDPGYALLRSETKFSSGITAWRETIIPTEDGNHSAEDLIEGQGFFGAQLIDPGVLLSIENDYFPVLLLREGGIHGFVATTLLLLILVAGLWIVSGSRFRHGSSRQRTRALASLVLGVVCIYQPLASLGVLPLTGISWPGFGLDSPSDFWVLLALVSWVLLWGERRTDDPALEEFDRDLRTTRLFRRVRAAVALSAAMTVVASLLLCTRAAAFALRRPNPVDPQGRAVKPFDSLERAVDYAFHLQCPWRQNAVTTAHGDADAWADALVPDDLLGDAVSGGVSRFHAALRRSWQQHRNVAIGEIAAFLRGESSCNPRRGSSLGPWTLARSPENEDECRLRFKVGWPEIELNIERDAEIPQSLMGGDTASGSEAEEAKDSERDGDGDGNGNTVDSGEQATRTRAHAARCSVDVRTDIVRMLRFSPRRPYRNARIRLVSRAMGDAARDRGELVSGHLSVRLRPGAGTVDVSRADAGMYFANEVHISPQLTITEEYGVAMLRRRGPALEDKGEEEAWLLLRDPPPSSNAGRVQVLEANDGTWKLLPPDDTVPLTRLALLVIGGPDARSLWLFRPPSEWPGEEKTVSPLVADDITTVRGERRRHYMFGGLVPEIGWVNPYHSRMSLGLDGWVRVAMGEYEKRTVVNEIRPDAPRWLDGGEQVPYCTTLDVATDRTRVTRAKTVTSGESGAFGQQPALDPTLEQVCHHSSLDGVLECRVSVQPELSIRLRHLTELISLEPLRYAGDDKVARPVRSNFTLMRGDTGEILAQGEFIPGRASSAYAPATPEIEQYLIRLREDRDPKTGRKLRTRGEASAEKIEWSQPIALGSTLKPLFGRAFELADSTLARSFAVQGSRFTGAYCASMKVHAILGHCPPTNSLWRPNWSRPNGANISDFLARSINWYQAAIGLVGTAATQRGSLGFGADDTEVDVMSAIVERNVGDHRVDTALWTRYRGKPVIRSNRTVRIDNLIETPLWRRFEQILGRRLCTAGNKSTCRRQNARKDLCAVRALPIDKPTSDLRHLVALGPSEFDFYPRLADESKRVGRSVSTREYLQFLRGSGLHPVASLAQLTDAFNRIIYEREPDARGRGRGFQLAASWFPVTPVGSVPSWSCTDPVTSMVESPVQPFAASSPIPSRTVASGLCAVVQRGGTASQALGPLNRDPRFIIYGAKTGTIDSLADVAEKRADCDHFAIGHTIPDQPKERAKQPYWLPCTKNRKALERVNDSLLVVSFAVRTGNEGDLVPLTLGLRFQRGGLGLAALVTHHYMDVIHDYFAPPETASPESSASTRSAINTAQ